MLAGPPRKQLTKSRSGELEKTVVDHDKDCEGSHKYPKQDSRSPTPRVSPGLLPTVRSQPVFGNGTIEFDEFIVCSLALVQYHSYTIA